MVCLGNELRSICCFWDCTQLLHFRFFCWLWGLLHFSQGILAYSSRYKWSSELNSPIPVHFSSLILKMLMFILPISCLTTSNLLWFMYLMFQITMQYCSLQHWTLLSPPNISTTGCCFHFGSLRLFILSGVTSLLFSSSILGTYWLGSLPLKNSIML